MIKIDYDIKQLNSNIFTVIVPNDYDRAMLFCKCQEFYESPNHYFRNKHFSIWNYIKWYSEEHNGSFSYPNDWCGFNIPFEVIKKCMEMPSFETPYDYIMNEIVQKVETIVKGEKAYIIGVNNIESSTYKHEVCHGLYYLNEEYKNIADILTKSLDKKVYDKFSNKLLKMGYTEEVIDDEIQAYLMTNHNSLSKGLKNIHNIYNKNLKKFL